MGKPIAGTTDKSEIITVSEARKIMGADAKAMSDEEVQELIAHLDSLARAFVQSVLNSEISYKK